MREPTVEQFTKDITEHVMTVSLDQGIYRHVRFKQPKSSNMSFDLTTWPGFLCISGDMGSWVFSRVDDMFTFFRDEKLRINPSYWAEKLRQGVHGGRSEAKVWDEDDFKKRLVERLDNYDIEPGELAELKEAMAEEIGSREGGWEMKLAARDFSIKLPSRQFQFDPCDLPDGMVYCYHFIWCLYAIVWGIQQYDAQRTATP